MKDGMKTCVSSLRTHTRKNSGRIEPKAMVTHAMAKLSWKNVTSKTSQLLSSTRPNTQKLTRILKNGLVKSLLGCLPERLQSNTTRTLSKWTRNGAIRWTICIDENDHHHIPTSSRIFEEF